MFVARPAVVVLTKTLPNSHLAKRTVWGLWNSADGMTRAMAMALSGKNPLASCVSAGKLGDVGAFRRKNK